MNVIHLSPYFYPKMGGMQNVAKEISERLSKKNHQVEVFTSDIGCPKDKQLKSTKNLKIHYLPAKEFAHTPIILSLYKELMKIPQDSIIHVHIAQAYVPEIVYKVWKKRKIPYVAQIHSDVDASSIFGRLFLNIYKKIILRRFLKNAKNIFVLTSDYKEIISKKYGIEKNKISIIPNGVREEFFIKRKKRKIASKLLFVGRIVKSKNPFDLIRTIEICNSRINLDIVGEGGLVEETKKLVKERKLKNITFHGKKEGKELVLMYKNADIFVSNTSKESFGITYIEAMASGLPIITSNIPAVRNVVKDNYNGILCEQTPEAFAQAIDKLIKDKKLRETLSKNGLKEVKKYSWDKIVKQTEDVYKEVLKEHNKQNETKKSKTKAKS
jgi:glycosyltransferase involved in cell wall biosynthesis